MFVPEPPRRTGPDAPAAVDPPRGRPADAATGGGPPRPPAGTPPGRPALDQAFQQDGLYSLRAAVAAHATDLGATADQADDLVVVANELASNAIRHGGGKGRLRLWHQDGWLVCQVTDAGRGLAEPEAAGRERAPVASVGGRGLWIVRQLVSEFDMSSSGAGTTVTVWCDLAPDSAAGGAGGVNGGEHRSTGAADAGRTAEGSDVGHEPDSR